MTRNMDEIAKAEFLIPALQKAIDSRNEKIIDWIAKFADNPLYSLEWSTGTFQLAAELDVYTRLRNEVQGWMTHQNRTEWTLEQLKEICVKEGSRKARYDAVGKSSSPTSNLCGQYTIQAWFELADDYWPWWFRDAQRNDPEYQAWQDAECARHAAEKAAKEEAEAQQEFFRQRKRREINKVLDNMGTPSDADLLFAYPATYSLRQPLLKKLVEAARLRAAQAQEKV